MIIDNNGKNGGVYEKMKTSCDLMNNCEKELCVYKTRDYKMIHYEDHVIYNGLYVRLATKKIYAGKNIFFSDSYKLIYKTKDMNRFDVIGNGNILGLVNEMLVWERHGDVFVHSADTLTRLAFYADGDKLAYKKKNVEEKDGSVNGSVSFDFYNDSFGVCVGEDVVENGSPCIYMDYLVVVLGEKMIFISLGDREYDVQYRMRGEISLVKIDNIDNVEFLRVEDNGRTCYFYYNELVFSTKEESEDMLQTKLSFTSWEYLVFKELGRNDQLLMIKRKWLPSSVVFHVLIQLLKKSISVIEFIKEWKSYLYDNNIVNINNISDNKAFEAFDNKIYDSITNENIDTTNYNISKILEGKHNCSIRGTENFRDNLFENETSQSQSIERTAKIFLLKLEKLKNYDFFYEKISPISDFFKTSKKINLTSLEFLTYHYKRLFFYDPAVLRLEASLPYRAISAIKKHSRIRKEPITNDLLFSSLHLIFNDSRAEEVFKIMTENSISFDKNILDGGNIPQACFLDRVFSSSGLFILSPANLSLDYSANLTMNKTSLIPITQEELLFYFFVANHMAHVVPTPEKETILSYATSFARNILGFHDSSKLSDFLVLLKKSELTSSETQYILLLLASSHSRRSCRKRPTKSMEPFLPDPCANHIFVSYLKKTDLKIKSIALACLAIYNLNSQNKNIFSILVKEAGRRGPITTDDRCVGYYNWVYRMLAAVSASLVSDTTEFTVIDDKFAELLLNGLAFIGTGIFGNLLKRNSAARPNEIFYSELFFLLNTFSLSLEQCITEINATIDTIETPEDINQLAGKIFYIAFKVMKDKAPITRQLQDWFYRTIEKTEKTSRKRHEYRVLFDFSLISFSILLNSSFNLKLLTIIRRQILRTMEPHGMLKREKFIPSGKVMTASYGPGFESIHYYKLCMAIVCCGFGTMKLKISDKIDFKLLIIAFFYMDDPFLSFRHIDLFKFLLYHCTVPNSKFNKKLNAKIVKNKRKRIRRKITKRFFYEFENKADIDKKYSIDVLTDFIENHATEKHRKNFSIKKLAKLLTITK